MVSILIRAENEEKCIGRTLEMLFSQGMRDFEVIVIDSGSTDKTVEIVKRFDVKLIKIPPQGFSYGYALNLGAKNAAGEIIVSLSAHAIPANEYWLENLIRPFNDLDVAGVYGRQLPESDCDPIEKKDLFESYGEERKVQTKDASFSNSNSAIRKSVWEKIPFSETMSFAEDIHWSKEVLENGYKIVYEPSSGVYHSHHHSLKEVYFRELNRHRGRLQRRQVFRFKNLISLMLEGMNEDLGFCIENNENMKWFFYIPIYHLVLFLARVQVQVVSLRKRIKKIRWLRQVYNYFVGAYVYRKAWLKYKWALLNESLNDNSRVEDILLIRTFGIGDIIRTTPIIEKLKKKYHNAKIYYFTYKNHFPVISSNLNIHRYFSETEISEVLKKEYDLVINWQIFDNCEYVKKLMRDIKAKRILGRQFNKNGDYHFDTKLYLKTWMEFFCEIAKVPYHKKDPEKTKIYFPKDDKKEDVWRKFNLNGRKKYVGICLGGDEVVRPEYWYRNFSVEYMERLVNELGRKYKLILVGQSKDRYFTERQKLKGLNGQPNVINLIDRLNLEELLGIVKNCDCLISSDTGLVHMTMALKVPLVALFSNNTGGIYISPRRRGKRYSILYNDKPNCFPCEQMFEKECLESRRARCIEEIPVSKIAKEVDRCISLY